MADDQTPHSDVIDDAIRQAERQLEEKLNALHMSAMGTVDDLAPHKPAPPQSTPRDSAPDVAVLRPPSGNVGSLQAQWSDEPTGDDPGEARDARPSSSPQPRATSTVSQVSATWDDEPPLPAGPAPSDRSTGSSTPRSGPVEAVPTEEELQFWAHTRTALRNLQQMTDQLPHQLKTDVTDEVERIVRDELGPSTGTLRLLQQQLQQGLPKIAERLESSMADELESATAIIRQLQDEFAPQLDRMARDVRGSVHDEIGALADDVRGSVHSDVSHLEQSVATNVTRMAQGINDSMSRVEQGMSEVGDQVGRAERALRSDLERVDTRLRDELTEPTELVRKLDDELPSRFERLERIVTEQVSESQRELSTVLAGLVDAGTATLARLADVARIQTEDRVRHAEDVEFLVETMTTGWEGLTKAMTRLYAFNEQQMQRIESLEQRLDTVGDIEQRVHDTTELMVKHIRELKPAPVMVTVNHPEAQVTNTTAGGYLLDEGDVQE